MYPNDIAQVLAIVGITLLRIGVPVLVILLLGTLAQRAYTVQQ